MSTRLQNDNEQLSTSTGSSCWVRCGGNAAASSNPAHASSTFGAQEMLLKELTDMNNAERQKVYEEVHGVRRAAQETPSLIATSIESMKTILKQEKFGPYSGSTQAFQRAKFLVPTRVFDKDMLLMFLRCEEFDIDQSVQRYLRFYEFSFQLFGLNGILHDVCQEDFQEQDDMTMLKSGCIVPLWNARDRSGRLVLFFHTDSARFKQSIHFIRSVFYVFWKAIKDPINQQRGIVVISWNLVAPGKKCHQPPITPSLVQESMAFFQSVPMRFGSAHFCYDDASVSFLREYALFVAGRAGRVRSRTWYGSATECKYNLMTFGIDVSKFPFDATNGEWNTDDYLQWIEAERVAEEQARAQETSAANVEPTTKDVLLGRGVPFRSFPGNISLGKAVQESWPTYQELRNTSITSDKTHLYRDILARMHQNGSRILSREAADQPWNVASEKQALKRISKSFRNKAVVDRYHKTKKKTKQKAAK